MFRIPWVETTPLGSYPADVIDDEIRNLKIGISERFDPIFGFDWADDDVDPKKFPGWLVSLENAVTVPIAGSVIVKWDFDRRPDSGYITIPDEEVIVQLDRAGLYMIGATVSWSIVGADNINITLEVNSQAVNIDRHSESTFPETSINRILMMLPLEVGDVLQIRATHDQAFVADIGQDGVAGNKFWGLMLGG